MIQTAAIIWAVLATGLGIFAATGWRSTWSAYDRATKGWLRAEGRLHYQNFLRVCAETRLGEIKRTRHLAAKKARAAQLAQRAAASTTEQIRKEIGR